MGKLGQLLLCVAVLLGSSSLPALTMMSTAFADGAVLPDIYAEEISEISPPLRWQDAPRNTAELVLIVDEPKESGPAIVHWVVYNIPPNSNELGEDFIKHASEDERPKVGLNHWAKSDWAGIEKSPATLRFRLYALKRSLRFKKSPDADAIFSAMEDLVIGKSEITAKVE